MRAHFNRFTIQMTRKQAQSAAHQGACDQDIESLCCKLERQLRKLSPADLAAELKEWGAWDETELADHEQNCRRIIWIAAGNILEEQ